MTEGVEEMSRLLAMQNREHIDSMNSINKDFLNQLYQFNANDERDRAKYHGALREVIESQRELFREIREFLENQKTENSEQSK